MRKILASLLALVFCNLNTVAYAKIDSDSSKKYEEIDIEKYNHIDLGLSGLALQGRYSYDITPYNELGVKVSYGYFPSKEDKFYLAGSGLVISIEDKTYLMKSSKYYSKSNSVVTYGNYIKPFASLNGIDRSSNFLSAGIGIGYDASKDNIGIGICLEFGSTLQMENNALAGVIFFRPELNFKIVF